MEERIKLLIVEDEMLLAAELSMDLGNLGYEVMDTLASGEAALDFIKNEQPDIVLMDINLDGELDGIETVALMQKELDIPVIFLTANSDDQHFNRAKETSPFAFISKPFKKRILKGHWNSRPHE